MSPERLWRWSRWAYAKGLTPLARLLKGITFLLFNCVLPYEAHVGGEVTLYHRGIGVVIHPDVHFEGDAFIAQQATIGISGEPLESGPQVVIASGVFIGAGARVIAPEGRVLHVGRQAAIGANAVVFADVAAGASIAAPAAVELHRRRAAMV
jgi:serine O-acetyltransferase